MKHKELIKLMVDKNIDRYELAKICGCTYACISSRFNGKTEFTLSQIDKIIKALDIPTENIYDLFF